MIKVVVSPFRMLRDAPPQVPLQDWTKMHVLLELRKAGVPVTGTLMPELKSGILERFDNPCDDTVTYIWRPETRREE